MTPKTRRKRLLLLRLSFLAVVGIAVLEICSRLVIYDSIYRDNECVSYAANGAPPSVPHRSFLPNCHTVVESPAGKPFEIATNEDGLRDRPRSAFKEGAVAVLGDSHVEGFAFPVEESFPRRLEAGLRRSPRFLNLGFRGTGPSEQIRIYEAARPFYPIRGAIWVLTENDIVDEFFAADRSDGSFFLGTSVALRKLSEALFHRHLRSLEWLRVATNSLALREALEHFDGTEAAASLCEAVKSLRLREGSAFPIQVVAIPHGRVGANVAYFGIQPDRVNFWKAMDCIREGGIAVADERALFTELGDHFLSDSYHLDAVGTELLAKDVAKKFSEDFFLSYRGSPAAGLSRNGRRDQLPPR